MYLFISKKRITEKSNNLGRFSSEFAESCNRTRRRITEEFRTENSIEELAYATQTNLRYSRKLDAAKIVREVRDLKAYPKRRNISNP